MAEENRTWGGREQITLRDVAREAGASQSAASVVLNGARSGTRVSAQKRRSLMEAAERMGYRPNGLARSLSTGRTNRIGVYSGRAKLHSRNAFYSELLGGVFDGAFEFGVNTMIHTSGNGEKQLLDLVSSRSIDGLIVNVDETDPILPLLGELRMPAVAMVDRVESLPSVSADDRTGGTMQARHLYMLGHRHVLVKHNPRPPRSVADRIDAFVFAAQQLDMRVSLAYTEDGREGVLDLEDIRVLSEGEDRATAVVGWSDFIAENICLRLLSLGVDIPGQVAAIGFDGFEHPCPPPFVLTTIRAPWAQVGREATRILQSLIEGKEVPALTLLPIEFFRGTTT